MEEKKLRKVYLMVEFVITFDEAVLDKRSHSRYLVFLGYGHELGELRKSWFCHEGYIHLLFTAKGFPNSKKDKI